MNTFVLSSNKLFFQMKVKCLVFLNKNIKRINEAEVSSLSFFTSKHSSDWKILKLQKKFCKRVIQKLMIESLSNVLNVRSLNYPIY